MIMNESSFIFGGVMSGEFLLVKKELPQFITPEEFSNDVNNFAKAAKKFFDNEIIPKSIDIQKDEFKTKINLELMKKAGEKGFLMLEIPERFDGLDMDVTSSMRILEMMTAEASFATTMMAHMGIGTLPLLFFGTEEQKKKYIPKLATGEWVAAYGLTETGYGSDALGSKTKAVLNEAKTHYILNGSKQFISNAGFANLFTIYAKIDGEHFTAFLIEKGTPGLIIGKEEDKLGIHGSSTCPLIFENCEVPIENLLGKIGEGHRSALGILNLGRLKLATAAVGGIKRVIQLSTTYANERKQFGSTIGSFGMIRHKIAMMGATAFASESSIYRVSSEIDKTIGDLKDNHPEFSQKIGKLLKEVDVETAIVKVMGSEFAATAIDEGVQIHGGYGFTEEYEVARLFRDSRINRIYEGTNEINRLLIPVQILTGAMKGKIDFLGELNRVLDEIKKESVDKTFDDQPLSRELKVTDLSKKMVVYTAGTFIQKYMAKLADKNFTFTEGEYFYEPLANMLIDLYAMESASVRGRKILISGTKNRLTKEYVELFVFEAYTRIRSVAMKMLSDLSKDEKALERNIKGLWRLTFDYTIDTVALKEKIATELLEQQKYII
jgi:alkylation response protein AidB-like acyl-CoA dehydrogenase